MSLPQSSCKFESGCSCDGQLHISFIDFPLFDVDSYLLYSLHTIFMQAFVLSSGLGITQAKRDPFPSQAYWLCEHLSGEADMAR